MDEDIVIVGAGIAGLATSLGLHRLGLRSLVLESSDGLRVTGFALGIWTNAWMALDALGVADSIRRHHFLLRGVQVCSSISGLPTSEVSFAAIHGKYETRCVKRNVLLEALEKELPHGTIRYSSKVVSIEESGRFKIVHLADGSVIKTKVLIGCDGVNSVVARWLGLPEPVSAGRSAVRAFAEFPGGHGFEPKALQYTGDGVRHGFIPWDRNTIYWFFAFSSSQDNENVEDNPARLKQFVLSNLGKVSPQAQEVVENTKLENMSCSPLRFRLPWQVLWGNISKENVCVAGDALHPMTPDIAQGGCAALEDAIVLARCLGGAFLASPNSGEIVGEKVEEEEHSRIQKSLVKFASERRWRSFKLIAAAYLVGFMQQSNGKVMMFLREKLLSRFMAASLSKISHYDCGKLDS